MFWNISNRTLQIAIFDFKAFLNMAMLLSESENAKVLRQIMLDIVIDFVNQRTGGSTKYINQRDQDFISAFLQEEKYRREFTDSNHQTNENELDAQAVGSHRGHQGSMGVKQDYSYEYKIYVHKNDYDKAVSLIR